MVAMAYAQAVPAHRIPPAHPLVMMATPARRICATVEVNATTIPLRTAAVIIPNAQVRIPVGVLSASLTSASACTSATTGVPAATLTDHAVRPKHGCAVIRSTPDSDVMSARLPVPRAGHSILVNLRAATTEIPARSTTASQTASGAKSATIRLTRYVLRPLHRHRHHLSALTGNAARPKPVWADSAVTSSAVAPVSSPHGMFHVRPASSVT